MADDNNITDNVTIFSENSDTSVTITTDGSKERLDVDANISGISATPGRVDTPVNEISDLDNAGTRISYTVPTGKVLYIQRLWCCHKTDAAGHGISFRVEGTPFYCMYFNNDGTTTFESRYPESNPYVVVAGDEVTAYREQGSSPEDWSCGFDGYLEDA